MGFFKNKEVDDLKVVVNNQNDVLSTLRYNLGRMIGLSHDGKRDIYDIYGYPRQMSDEGGFRLMYDLSKRMGIANRITFGVAKPCWRDGFEIYQDSTEEAKEIEDDSLTELFKTDVIRKLERSDILNRIGRFSCLYVGVAGDDPLTPIWESGVKSIDELFFKSYAYDGIQISGQVNDPEDKRYGLPEYYQVQKMSRGDTDKDTQKNSMRVHWSRIIHMNENALDSDVEGMGALEPVLNRLRDYDKAVGGSAEAYFRNARRIITQEVDPNFASALQNNETAAKDFKKKTQAFTNGWQDYIVASGSKIGQLQTSHSSPLDTARVILWEISGYTGIPLRVLTGEGAGQLAGSEDQLAFNAIIADRQKLICTGWVRNLFWILEQAGLIELPEDYDIRFPVQQAVTEMQETEINHKRAQTIDLVVRASSQPGGDDIDVIETLKTLGIEVKEESFNG